MTFDALIYYFYLTGKLEKNLIDSFEEAEEEASAMLGKEMAKELVEDYFHDARKRSFRHAGNEVSVQKKKRAKFTYEIGEIAMQEKAKTSLERAKKFNEEIRKILNV